MLRVPEPELMDNDEQALAYANADFEEPHSRFMQEFKRVFPKVPAQSRVLDLGCGPADITVRFAQAFPDSVIDAVDGSQAMLKHAQHRLEQLHLNYRINLHLNRLPVITGLSVSYEIIIANSLLHHLATPDTLWQAVKTLSKSGTLVLIMDLLRPASQDAARDLVDRYAAYEPEVLKKDFFNSLMASYRVDEIQTQIRHYNLLKLKIEVISDRHWIVYGVL